MNNTLLIVNRSKEQQQAIGKVLSSFKMKLHCVENGSEALALTKRLKPRLIISRVDNEAMDGITMADILGKDKLLKNTPIIFVHKELDLSLIAAAKQVNSKAFLIKPYLNSSLIYAVKRVLELSEEHSSIRMNTATRTSSYLYA
ncbi:MAG: response regulator [Bacteroidota bacterium]